MLCNKLSQLDIQGIFLNLKKMLYQNVTLNKPVEQNETKEQFVLHIIHIQYYTDSITKQLEKHGLLKNCASFTT